MMIVGVRQHEVNVLMRGQCAIERVRWCDDTALCMHTQRWFGCWNAKRRIVVNQLLRVDIEVDIDGVRRRAA